ncbi:GNAT family N-acetyltransferase [Kribbella deserti]|uniref:GNAT family N-acetyltransferase n=1 Tax=Kribbella deserti TaxID=1926257 RepID=A0ABV6QNV2_9ACTN
MSFAPCRWAGAADAFWSARLAAPAGTATVLAEYGDQLAGFVHVVLDHEPKWGSLVDNLHVHHSPQRSGIGTRLLARAAEAVTDHATSKAMYLWVLRQNLAAQRFYLASGATCRDTATAPPPGGDPARLNGSPECLRMTWRDASQVGDH